MVVQASIVRVKTVVGTQGALQVISMATIGDPQTLTVNTKSTVVAALTGSAFDESAGGYEKVVWRIANSETTGIYVAFGGTPDASVDTATASTTARRLIPAGQTQYIAVGSGGEFVEYVAA